MNCIVQPPRGHYFGAKRTGCISDHHCTQPLALKILTIVTQAKSEIDTYDFTFSRGLALYNVTKINIIDIPIFGDS